MVDEVKPLRSANMARQLPADWLSRTLIRSWMAFEDGQAFRYEVREDPVSGLKVKARMPVPRSPTPKALDMGGVHVV